MYTMVPVGCLNVALDLTLASGVSATQGQVEGRGEPSLSTTICNREIKGVASSDGSGAFVV